eukprot:scaffold7727_cov258-Pinguiococcus_pyrenoidosus.AAC.5
MALHEKAEEGRRKEKTLGAKDPQEKQQAPTWTILAGATSQLACRAPRCDPEGVHNAAREPSTPTPAELQGGNPRLSPHGETCS